MGGEPDKLGDNSYIAEHTRDFTGREWVFAKIDRWLGDPDAPRFFIITGEPVSWPKNVIRSEVCWSTRVTRKNYLS